MSHRTSQQSDKSGRLRDFFHSNSVTDPAACEGGAKYRLICAEKNEQFLPGALGD